MSARTHARPLHRLRSYRAVAAAWDGPYVLACSGGVDSTALLALAAEARDRSRIPPFVCCHVDHHARPGSAADADVVAENCARLRTPFVRVEVRPGSTSRESNESELRDARYEALANVVWRCGAEGVVTSHTMDDQVETILFRLLTGVGPLGATGMKHLQSLESTHGTLTIVRPLLDIRKTELAEIVAGLGLTIAVDPTNESTGPKRNWLRHRVFPVIAEAFPGFGDALVRAVALSREEAELADDVAERMAGEWVERLDAASLIDRRRLLSAHPAIARRVIRREAARVMGENLRELTFERVDSVLRAVHGHRGVRIELPSGVVAVVEHDAVRIQRSEAT